MKNLILLITAIVMSTFVHSQTISLNDTSWFRNGPFSAHVNALAISPSNPNVVYIGLYADGVYKSVNAGQSWTKCSTENLPVYEDSLTNNDPFLPCWWQGDFYPVYAVAVDPQDENHVWAGTRGVFESVNGGNTWQKAGETLPDTVTFSFININPQNPDDILAGANGLYRTLDGGNSWTLINEIPHGNTYRISDIKRDPTDNNHILIGMDSSGEPIFSWGMIESYDNGNTWQQVMSDFPVYDLSINPENNQNIWAVVLTGYQDWLLMYSNDGGHNWDLYEGFDDPYQWIMSMYSDADFNLYIERMMDNGFFSILKSTDMGNSWSEVDKLFNKGYYTTTLGNHCQAETSNANNIYFGTYYGIFHSDDGGMNTQLTNTNLMNSYILDIEVNPFNENIVYAAGHQGLWKSTNGCRSWEKIINDYDYLESVKCDPKNPDIVYAGGAHLFKSYDGGATFQDIFVRGGLCDIAINPVNTNIIYVEKQGDENDAVYRSTDSGATWNLIFYDQPTSMRREIIIDPLHPDTLYVGVHRSTDGGNTWESYALDKLILAVHPDNSNILYGSDPRGGTTIDVSYDWGSHFQRLAEYHNGPFPGENIYCLRIDKENPNYMYYSTRNTKVYYTTDAGSSWQTLEGSYGKRVTDIIPFSDERKYYLATHGDGVWVYDTITPNAIGNDIAINDDNYLTASPNPFNDQLAMTYKTDTPGNIILQVYNFQGQLIKELMNEYKPKGEYKTLWNGKDLNGKEVSPGLYLVRLQSGRKVYTHKVVLLK